MAEFAQLVKGYMDAYEHNAALLAETTGKTQTEIESIMDGTTVPGEDFMLQLIELYHLGQNESAAFRKSWQKTRLRWIEKCNKLERQLHAFNELPTLNFSEDATLPERMIFVLVASQYYYNTVHSIEAASPVGQELIEMRNQIVYNYGSNACKELLVKLQGPDWLRYTEEVRTRVLP